MANNPLENRPLQTTDGGYAVTHGGTPSYNTDSSIKGWQVTSATSTTVVLHADANTTDDYFNGATMWITTGTGNGEAALITDYVGSTRTATVSFTTTPDTTSYYLIDTTGLRTLSDNASLRHGTYTAATAAVGDKESALLAKVTDYNLGTGEWTVTVRWGTKQMASDESTPASGANLVKFEIRSSRIGYPEFPGDEFSDLILEKSALDATTPTSPSTTVATTDSHTSKWLYISLIYTYLDSSGNKYNEIAAKSAVLIPTYHNTAKTMWSRIPDYYQRLDTTSHLEKFIKVFAWENDMYVSLINELMHTKDSDRVHYDSLDSLTKTAGIPFTSSELRPHQLRELLKNSYQYHVRKGRADSLMELLGLMSDTEVSFREFRTTAATTADVNNRHRLKYTVCAERINLITDPRLKATPGTSATWHYLTNASAGSITADDTPAGGSAGTDPGIKFTTGASDAGTAYIFPNTPVQIKRNIPYYCNIEASTLTNATLQLRLYREKPTSASSLPPESKYFNSSDSTGASSYKTMSEKVAPVYTSGEVTQKQGFGPLSGVAEANSVYISGTSPVANGKLFRAVLYTSVDMNLSNFTMKLTPDGSNVSSSSRFDQFDLAINDGTSDVLTATNLTLSVSGTTGTIIDEDDSSTVTKLTNTTGGVTYTLLIDEVSAPAYATTTKLPSSSAMTFPFIDNGVEWLYPTIVVTLSNNSEVLLDKFIFQPFQDGEYFDGDSGSTKGQALNVSGNIVRDYYWSGATAHASTSIYTPLRGRMRKTITKALREYLPVTMTASTVTQTGQPDPVYASTLTDANYHTSTDHGAWVVFDKTPGDEYAFDPHSWSSNVYTEGTIKSLSD